MGPRVWIDENVAQREIFPRAMGRARGGVVVLRRSGEMLPGAGEIPVRRRGPQPGPSRAAPPSHGL
jgi:hypothetical protein